MSKSSLARSRTRLPLESVTTTSMLVMSTRALSATGANAWARGVGVGAAGWTAGRDGLVCAVAAAAANRNRIIFFTCVLLAQQRRFDSIIPRAASPSIPTKTMLLCLGEFNRIRASGAGRAHRREAKKQGAREKTPSPAGEEDCCGSFLSGRWCPSLQQRQSAER